MPSLFHILQQKEVFSRDSIRQPFPLSTVQCTLYSTVCMHTIEKANFYKLQIGQHFLNTNKYENKNYVFLKWRFKFPKITNPRS